LDYEVFDVLSATGFDAQGRKAPLPSVVRTGLRPIPDLPGLLQRLARTRRLVSERQGETAPDRGMSARRYFCRWSTPNEAPVSHSLRQLSVQARCTNRDLSLFLIGGGKGSSFTLEAGIPLNGVRAIAGPSRPYTALREGGVAWRLINLLSLELSLACWTPMR
jgi:type VI secretion system protein ImpG